MGVKTTPRHTWVREHREVLSSGIITVENECFTLTDPTVVNIDDTVVLDQQISGYPKCKYVRFEGGDTDFILCFTNDINHDEMAKQVMRLSHRTNFPRVVPISAGFINSKWQCSGRSETLRLDFLGNEDTELLTKQLEAVNDE